MLKLALIFLGGGTGACLRYLVVLALQKPDARAFPWGTLAVNTLGCALIGVAMAWFAAHERIKPEHQLAITIGLLGGFTTFSAYAYEVVRLTDAHEIGKAALYALASNALGLGAAAVCSILTMRALGK